MRNYQIHLHTSDSVYAVVYCDYNTESHMYSHLNAIEHTLEALRATTEIEIIENGESRWIEYRDGNRTDMED